MGEPALAAGWYPDPWQQGELRWHDGAEWTGHVHAAQAAQAQAQAAQEAPTLVWAQEPEQEQQLATVQLQAEPVQEQPLSVFAQQAPETASMAMPSMEETLAGDRERARERNSSRQLVLLGVMAVIALAAVAFVLLGRGGDAPLDTAPAAMEPAVALDPAAAAPAPLPTEAPDAGALESAAQLAQEAPGTPAPTEPAAVPAPEAAPAPAPTGEQIPELAAPAS